MFLTCNCCLLLDCFFLFFFFPLSFSSWWLTLFVSQLSPKPFPNRVRFASDSAPWLHRRGVPRGSLSHGQCVEDVPRAQLGKRVTQPMSAPLYSDGPRGTIMVPGPKFKFLNFFIFDLYRSYGVTWGYLRSFDVIWKHLKLLKKALFRM